MDVHARPGPSPLSSAFRRAARGLRAAALALLACGAPGLAAAQDEAAADPPGRVGRVALVSGTVRTPDVGGHWTALQRTQPLTTGDQVFTDQDGRAVLQVGSTTVRLGENSGLTFARLDDEKVQLHFDH